MNTRVLSAAQLLRGGLLSNVALHQVLQGTSARSAAAHYAAWWRSGACAGVVNSSWRQLSSAIRPPHAHGQLLPHLVRFRSSGALKPWKIPNRQRKIKCLRNDRFRRNYEQIWPNKRLTERQLAMFRKTSRLFVVELGRVIALKTKFNLNIKEKPSYQESKTRLYESDMHLDAVGEHPRFLRIRRLNRSYAIKLQNVRKIRLLLGFARRKHVQRMYEESIDQKGSSRVWKMICGIESKLGMFAMRMGLAENILAAKRLTVHDHINVNGAPSLQKRARHLVPGDVVSPSHFNSKYLQFYISRELTRARKNEAETGFFNDIYSSYGS